MSEQTKTTETKNPKGKRKSKVDWKAIATDAGIKLGSAILAGAGMAAGGYAFSTVVSRAGGNTITRGANVVSIRKQA